MKKLGLKQLKGEDSPQTLIFLIPTPVQHYLENLQSIYTLTITFSIIFSRKTYT